MDIAQQLLLEFRRKSRSGYGHHKECEALVSYVLKNMSKSKLPPLEIAVKDDDESIKYREEGNFLFVSGNDLKAIELYSKSLAFAKSDEMMSYARANRSAALYRKKLYIECIVDVTAALTMNYPPEKADKLRERGQKALNRIKEHLQVSDSKESSELLKLFEQYEKRNDAKDKAKDSLKYDKKIENGDLEIELKEMTIEKLEKKKQESLNISAVSGVAPEPRYMTDEGKPVITHGPNNEAPVCSKGVRICYSKKYGRHMVATKQFRPGDVVCVEEPFTRVVYIQKYYTHCNHCLIRNYNLIPCPHCPISMYCSEKCRTDAWNTAHKIECSILPVLTKLLTVDQDKVNQIMKIIRFVIILTDGGKSINKLKKDLDDYEMNPDPRTAGFTDERIFESHNPVSALSLATNFNIRPFGDVSALACVASLSAIIMATQTNFFGKKYSVERLMDIGENPDVRFCSTLMLRAAVIMSSNSFSVQIEPGTKSGSGLYVVHSLFNHACAPNTIRHFDGLTMISRALVPIYPGEQVFTSYCSGYQYAPKVTRQRKILDDYYFECDCLACTEDWPSYSDIMAQHIGTIANDKVMTQKMAPLRARIKDNKYDIEAIKSTVELLYKETKMPCEEMVTAVQYLKSYYLGKFDKMTCTRQ